MSVSAAKMRDATSPLPATAARARHRFYDSAQAAWIVKVLPGEYAVAEDSNEILATILGSCVSACMRDPQLGIGGMNHFMLGESKGGEGSWDGDAQSTRYGNYAMEKLVNELLKRGCARERLEVKLFGGANVTAARTAIGSQNAEFAMKYLAAEGFRCAAQDLGGTEPRRIIYYPVTGRVVRRLLNGSDGRGAVRDESAYAQVLQARPQTDNIELFK